MSEMAKKSLAFFMGGDNFMVVSTPDAKESASEFIDKIKKERGVTLNCGIGTAKTLVKQHALPQNHLIQYERLKVPRVLGCTSCLALKKCKRANRQRAALC